MATRSEENSKAAKLSPAQQRLLTALASGPRSFSDSNANMFRVASCLEKHGLATIGRGKEVWTWTVTRMTQEAHA